MKKYSKSHHSSLHELNITPLLDLAFVLLVIFIITTAPTVNDIDINLPSAAGASKDEPKPKINNIAVDRDGKVYFNGNLITIPELKATLIEFIKADPEISVMVRGDEGVEYQKIVQVLDVLTQANVTKVGLATELAGM
ncbi:MAG TPA: biopolymer transporter ExbD [Methylomirabilota bacterium]|nr:biopolymer transporter ExbD [Methylomirabilota bacterium]